MSTAARKARKRAGEPLVRTPKEGTPVEQREENKPRTIRQLGSWRAKRFGLTPAAERRLKARGLDRQYEGPAEK